MTDLLGASSDDLARTAMRAALGAAQRGTPSPNPHVGAVLVRNGAVLSVGWHRRPGDPHAEVVALSAAGTLARGATLYVTLEPCNHHGRTPPCTEAILRAGVSHVVFACTDPNPHVQGGGRQALESGGVTVTEGFDSDHQAEALRSIAPWRTFIVRGRSHVTLKVGMSLDGRIATRAGESRWITSAEARRDAHTLRAAADAVLVGSGTVTADNPELTARDVPVERQPVRVVVDARLVLSPTARLLQSAREVPTWVLTTEGAEVDRVRALEDLGVTVIVSGPSGGRVDLALGLQKLATLGVVGVLCEGGGRLHGALLDKGLADRVVCYIAPMLLGRGTAGFAGDGWDALADAQRLGAWRVDSLGSDLRVEAECVHDVHGDHPDGR